MSETWIAYEDLTALVGVEAAGALCAALGGAPVYVARRPSPDGDLARAAGMEAAGALAAAYGGETVVVPTRRAYLRARQTGELLRQGLSCRETARRVGLTERRVRQIARQIRTNPGGARQASLWD